MTSAATIWPDFFIAGAAKCGTTSLYVHLKKHPQVFLSEMKEPNFFTEAPAPEETLLRVARCATQAEYEHLYKSAGGYKAVGDASPSYLWDSEAPQRIHQVCPGARIIIMLRDPVARAHSHYLDNVLHGIESAPTFSEALQRDNTQSKMSWFASPHYIEVGKYYEQVRRFLNVFGAGQVAVFLSDDLSRDAATLFSSIAAHIGIDNAQFQAIDVSQSHNSYRMPKFKAAYQLAGRLGLRTAVIPSSVRRYLSNSFLFNRSKPLMDEQSRRFLQEIYDPDIVLLEDLLRRKMPELRKSWLA
jgi:hypothetical protein